VDRTRAPSSAKEEADPIGLSPLSITEEGECRTRGSGPLGPQIRFSLRGLSLQAWRPDHGEYCKEEEEEEEEKEYLDLKVEGGR
jgi:hypothetical protein